MRILLADDYEDIRTQLTALFEHQGWEVTAAADGREALDLYRKFLDEEKYFDVILLDVDMPYLNGFVVGVEVRNIEKLGDAPRAIHIYLTGEADVAQKEELLSTHFADDYLHKPFDPTDLIRRIKRLVGRAQTPPTQTVNTEGAQK